jgi:hypothetical protein
MDLIPTNKIVVTPREYGHHVSATFNNALIYSSYCGYCDPRLTNDQKIEIIESVIMPGWRKNHYDHPDFHLSQL